MCVLVFVFVFKNVSKNICDFPEHHKFIFLPFNKIVVIYVGKIVFLKYFALLDFFHLQESNTQSCSDKV